MTHSTHTAPTGLRARIHRGAHEIGGNCVELECEGERLLLDLGRPLDASGPDEALLPDVAGLRDGGDRSLLGVVLSHPHQDHYSLIPSARPDLPVYVGEAAAQIINEAAWFIPSGVTLKPAGHLRHRQPLVVGPFRVTPFLNDHSAYDAYSLLVEAAGRRLFYTGDIRGSGRKARMFDDLCARPPANIHALLMEGTHVRPPGHDCPDGLTEGDVEGALTGLCRAAKGMVLIAYSGQNIDRLVSIYRACVRSRRELVVDLYGATMGWATGNASVPQPGHRNLRVLVPQSNRVRIKLQQDFERVSWLGPGRIFPDELAAHPERFVVTLRGGTAPDLERADCLQGAQAVWSMWPGYLGMQNSAPLREFFARHHLPLATIHASGHATVAELARLVDSLEPERVVPIHSSATERFADHFERVEPHPDGQWWSV